MTPFAPARPRLTNGDAWRARVAGHLLGVGGTRVVWPRVPQDVWEMEMLCERAVTWDGGGALEEEGEPSQCHRNTALLYELTRGALPAGGEALARRLRRDYGACRIVTGWALSEDGGWREHSWGLREDRTAQGGAPAQVIETTERRLRYVGTVLTDEEAEAFAFYNA